MPNKMNIFNTIKSSLYFASYFLLAIWCIEAINFVMNHSLNQYGILPRDISKMWHILSAPFIHGFPLHAVNNSIPLFVLLIFADFHGRKNLIICLMVIILFCGLMTWLVARPGYHLGASSLIFGLWGYLIGMGFKQRDLKSIALATITFLLYGGLAYQLLELQLDVSWEGHIFGALGGLFASLVLSVKKKQISK
jgi:membrane associated rhomboid family serine protease